jgi:hypothetical protein
MPRADSYVPRGLRERGQLVVRVFRRPILRACLVGAALWLAGWAVQVAPSSARAAAGAGAKAMWGPVTLNGKSQFPVYHDLGVKIYEADVLWSSIATRRPRHATDPKDAAYRWPRELDVAIAQARVFHMRVALQIIGTPAWANGARPSNWAPSRSQDFAFFAAAAARRYPSVHLWMIWGEPSRSHNFEPFQGAQPFATLNARQSAAPRRYAVMLDAAYGALKRVSRANLVIGGMTYTTGEITTPEWIANMRLPNGRAPRLDMYGHNPFSFRDPDLANPPSGEQAYDFSDLRRLAQLVDRYLGRPRLRHPQLFLSEWTIPTAVDQEFNFFVDPPVQARWITDALHIVRTWPRIYALGWIHLYDNPPMSFGGLLQTNGTQKPGYAAWKGG